MADFAEGRFLEAIDDSTAKAEARKRYCVRKDLLEIEKARQQIEDPSSIRLIRVEQLYPFPADVLKSILGENAKDVIWAQEEPQNAGAFTFVRDQLTAMGLQVHYIGRAAASPATGSMKKHRHQQSTIIESVLSESVLESVFV